MPRVRPPVIGLVGGIGSGKSAVAAAWRDAGCCVCESDQLARQALEDPNIRATLIGWWGRGILGADDRIDRAAIAKIVFGDATERKRLEGLTHPWIERTRRAAFAAAPASTPAFVIDAPLLLEVGLDRECDAVVFIDAPRSERLRRVRESRGWSEEELDRREAAQWSLERKRAASTHSIVNGGDLNALRLSARTLLTTILKGSRR